ncbi:MAG: DciA family protein [Acidiferrobacterales bacterium]
MPVTLARRIGSFFSPDVLAHLGLPADLRILPQVNEAWMKTVGEPLCRHVHAVRYARGQLSLCADSSAWAGRVRYQQQSLVDQLRRTVPFDHLIGLHVRIAPPGQTGRAAVRPVRRERLSAASRRLLGQVADDIADPGLREALVRLGRGSDEGS